MENIFQISTDKSKLDIGLIRHYLSKESYWAQGRSLETVKKSIENSMCFGVFCNNKQVGFARVITDFAVFAWILDVFIVENYRKNGLGKAIMHEIMHHEDLQQVSKWGLGTADAHGLYQQFGFQSLEKPESRMELKRSN